MSDHQLVLIKAMIAILIYAFLIVVLIRKDEALYRWVRTDVARRVTDLLILVALVVAAILLGDTIIDAAKLLFVPRK
jgi:threonine/homoserine/homoserine lactone efflux protein